MVTVSDEVIACILEINSDVKFILNYELADGDVTESLNLLSNRLNSLINSLIRNEIKNDCA